jgi:dUTP pyrophosphatase
VIDSPEVFPERQTLGSAGYDLRAKVSGGVFPLLPYVPTPINCGFKIEIPQGYHGKVCIRSSLSKKGIIIPNAPGIIDSDYRGYVIALLMNMNSSVVSIRNGERIAQLLIEKNVNVNWSVEKELSKTSRGEGGFGSTGLGV